MYEPLACLLRNGFKSLQTASSQQTLQTKRSMEVPHEVQERFIHSGYRHVDSGVVATVTSLWRSHNETINIWSHVLALLYFVVYFYDDKLQAVVSLVPAAHRLPLYVYFLGVCLLFLASSGAHLLNSISMTWRNVCFMIDYSAISVYGSFAAIYYYYYHHTRIVDVIRYHGSLFLITVLATAILATWASCHTRLFHTPHCHLIRTSAFTMPYLIGNFPVLIRFFAHVWNNSATFVTHQSLVSTASYADEGWYFSDDTDNAQDIKQAISEDEFFRGYMRHMVYLTAAAIVNVIKVPERWYPGYFDILAHSHQWFHLLIFLGIREQFWLIVHDLHAQYDDPLRHAHLLSAAPDLYWVTALYVVLISTLTLILTVYGSAIHNKEKAKLM